MSEPGTDLVPATPAELTALDKLSAPERVQARRLAAQLNTGNSNAVLTFGTQAQSQLNAKVDPALKAVATRDTGEAGKLIIELLDNTRKYDPSAFARGGRGLLAKIPLIGKKLDDLIASYEKIGTHIDELIRRLERHEETMLRDIATLDDLYGENEKFRQALLLYVAAGEIKLSQLEREHQQLLQQAQSSGQPEDAQAATGKQSQITRLERKVHNLKVSALISFQTGPKIRLVQEGDLAVAENIQIQLLTSVPLFKREMVVAIAQAKQKSSLETSRQVNDTLNTLIRRDADMLRQQSGEIAREVERDVVDIETLRHSHEQLIGTIEDVLRIQQEARQRREQEAATIEQLQNNLQAELTKAQSQPALPQ